MSEVGRSSAFADPQDASSLVGDLPANTQASISGFLSANCRLSRLTSRWYRIRFRIAPPVSSGKNVSVVGTFRQCEERDSRELRPQIPSQ